VWNGHVGGSRSGRTRRMMMSGSRKNKKDGKEDEREDNVKKKDHVSEYEGKKC
jgi:hypothetical protein